MRDGCWADGGQLSSSPFFSPVWPSVQSVINHPVSPDMASRCCDTQSLCVCVSIALVCLCALLLCVLILSPRICLYAHACYMLTTMFVACSSAFACQCVGACEEGGSHRQLVSVCDIYDTFYLFIVVLPPVTTSPRGNQASLVLISNVSQMVCLRGKGERLMEVVKVWEFRIEESIKTNDLKEM